MSRLGQHEVGHEGVITGCDAFSLRSSIADPRESRPAYTPINQWLITWNKKTACHKLYWHTV
ncbi:hypothetical protein C7Y47_10035 [Lysinibacillus sphaericus]|uniref:Uncharacterized protein n=1 Tax=Lysinibacillus sphaericus TaxID=1421 RepID=A0A544ULD2_LYSSH|nr:hypothetical protein [Lysinibacillus sp. SDF0037]TQR34304.1 hypothetical protein C7Y47_10035 [Lysinibacillus sp. SDF0037]